MLTIYSILVISSLIGVKAVEFQIKNNLGGEVWIGIQGNPGKEHLRNGGFKLGQGAQESVNAPDGWAGRIWARTYCDQGSNHCQTGDCGNKLECSGAGGVPPATLAEIKLKGDSGLDFYDISLVDGFNVQASITPIGGQSDGSERSCKRGGCNTNVNDKCPAENQIKANGQTVACKSACLLKNSDETCCRGAFNSPDKCKAGNNPPLCDWCPKAYCFAYDDPKTLFTCKNAQKYVIEFS